MREANTDDNHEHTALTDMGNTHLHPLVCLWGAYWVYQYFLIRGLIKD